MGGHGVKVARMVVIAVGRDGKQWEVVCEQLTSTCGLIGRRNVGRLGKFYEQDTQKTIGRWQMRRGEPIRWWILKMG